ncbi:MAG TPA: hypothetical protein VGI16_13830 [Candidatus Acidoferrum sp.]|jgi:hypothetical protein
MQVRTDGPDYGCLPVARNSAVRTGVCTGVSLSLVFSAWLFVANRVPSFEHFALDRNLIAASVLGLIAFVPVLRFLRMPGNLLASSLISWSILTITYRILCIHFWSLGERYSASQIFILGCVVYMIIATVSWIGLCIWKARSSHAPHSNHHVS